MYSATSSASVSMARPSSLIAASCRRQEKHASQPCVNPASVAENRRVYHWKIAADKAAFLWQGQPYGRFLTISGIVMAGPSFHYIDEQ
jgi:hypothetical protein